MSAEGLLSKYSAVFDENIASFIPDKNVNYSSVINAADYSLSAGGKRIRPALIMEFCRIFSDDFSVSVSYDDIKAKNYSLSAGQYFEVKIEYVEITADEFNQKMADYTANLDKLFSEGKTLEDEIKQRLGELKYD